MISFTPTGCWFHLSQDLNREARLMGLLNNKNKNIDINITYEIITQLTLLPINYKGNIENLNKRISEYISHAISKLCKLYNKLFHRIAMLLFIN